jgi:hypothetical protein
MTFFHGSFLRLSAFSRATGFPAGLPKAKFPAGRHGVRTLAVLASLLLLLLLALHVLPFVPVVSFTWIAILASALFLWLAHLLLTTTISRAALFTLLTAGLIVRASFLNLTPIGSDDFYRYLWDGKVQAHGINPYRYAPSDPELRDLHSEKLSDRINHPDMKTVYLPFTQWMFFLSYRMSGEGVWGFKLLLLLAEAASLLSIFLLLRHFAMPEGLLLLYALCPLPIIQFAIDAHLDGLGFPLLLGGLLMYARGRVLPGLVLLGLSLAVKPVGLVILPALFFQETNRTARARIVMVPLLTVAVQFLPYLAGTNPFDSLLIFAQNWLFNGPVFSVLQMIIANSIHTRLVCAVLLVLVLAVLSPGKKTWLEKTYYAILALLLLSPVVHPWYVGWLAVVLPLVPRWSGMVYVSTVSLTAFTVLHYAQTGVWYEYPLVLVFEYLPVLILLALELRGRLRVVIPPA